MKHSSNQLQVNSSTLYPITIPESPHITPTTDLELTVLWSRTQHGIKDPSPPCMGGRGLYALTYWWNGRVTVQWPSWSSPYSKQRKGQPLSALLAWAMDHHQETHILAKDILHRVVALQTQTVEPPLVSMVTTWKLRRYLRLRLLLLQHSGETNRTPHCVL